MLDSLLALSQLISATFLVLHAAFFVVGQDFVASDDALRAWAGSKQIPNLDFNAPLGPFDIRLVYCSDREGSTCGGTCYAYQGPGSRCIQPEIKVGCLAATRNLQHCWLEGCTDCHEYRNCATRLESGFCWTPETFFLGLSEYTIPLTYSFPKPESTTSSRSSSSSVTDPRPATTSQSDDVAQTSNSDPSTVTSSSSSRAIPSLSSNDQTLSLLSTAALVRPSSAHSSSDSLVASPLTTSSTSASQSDGGSKGLPVGAIVGVALGSLALVLAVLLFWIWIRIKRTRKATQPENNIQAQPLDLAAPGWPVSAAPSSAQHSVKAMPSTIGPLSSTSISSSSRSMTTTQRSGPSQLEILHEDSGMRITTSMYGQVPIIEHPPPYSI